MKLCELVNIQSPGNKTNLSGGDLPNAYSDDVNKTDKTPRKKQKDVYGTGVGTGINSTGTEDSGGETSTTSSGEGGTTSTSGGDGGSGGGGE